MPAGTEPADTEPATTPAVVRAAALRWPGAEALVDGEVRMTFAQLGAEVERVAHALVATGLRPGDRVGIWAPNCWEWVITALGTHAAGGVVVPLNTRYKGDEAAYILHRSGARLLFTVRGFLGTDYPELLAGRATPIKRTVVFRSPSWDEFLRLADTDADADTGGRAAGTLPEVNPDDLADLLFTSGTTGRPKGVMTTHRQTVSVPRAWADVVGLRAGDRHLVVSPFFHTFGYRTGILADLIVGATTLPLAVVEVDTVLRLVSAERVTTLPGTPTLFQSILDDPALTNPAAMSSAAGSPRAPDLHGAGHDLSSLRLSAVGAASVPVELVLRMRAELFDVVVTGYGLTESTGVATMSRPDDPPEVVSRGVGRPLPGVEIQVVGPDGSPQPPGVAGEVLVRGHNVMSGYFDDPQETAAVIDADGWLHTGDVGVLDDDGYLAITDRLKDMYIVGGFNAYPAEIEAALLRHPGVAMAAVIGVPDRRLGEVGMAFLVRANGHSPNEEEIIAWCRTEMANYKVPRVLRFVDALPVNPVGKIVKPTLRNWATAPRAGAHTIRDDGHGRS
ncbi:3-((3aS,4S,7aS)-7a-methyl-1, 5-dioxo-octahydro-1H-inden-4-yl)propanoyl:CoA ligase [Frankia sp. AiPs1]|uniref:FadD3 family acyl-CoA ligase n=1 Tax=Frankia sp. AiPa1 TaxID=573492 RepID=UPI00202B76B4|nr:FadD3 family acyl-CoA ligase [Frankia sp. AiPa1]MCL9758604.1 FadD3 family acyl-CoA ligase [Frankia sp. AiPa1]